MGQSSGWLISRNSITPSRAAFTIWLSVRISCPSAAGSARGHGLDVLFQVKHFDGIGQQALRLPPGEGGEAGAGALRLGVMATLRLQSALPASAP